jgi:hypothetical protein
LPAPDTAAPVISSGVVSPSSVQVCQTVSTIKVLVTDNVGTAGVQFRILYPSGVIAGTYEAYRISGTSSSGNWSNDWIVPCGSPTGTYSVFAQARDSASNTSAWSAVGTFNATPLVIVDTAPPIIVSGFVSPGSVEVCKTVSQISALITDNVDTASMQFRILNPNGAIATTFGAFRKDGSGLSGNWSNDWVIPCGSPIGTYTVMAQARDTSVNISEWKTIGTFVGTAPIVVDTANPVIVSGSALVSTVEVCKTFAGVDVAARDDTGLATVEYRFIDPWGTVRATNTAYRNSGTKLDGVFRNDYVIPCNWPSGTYQIEARGTDEWKKTSGWVNVTAISITSPTANPVQYPMVIGITGASAFTKSNLYTFFETVLHVESRLNWGLTSLGHLLTVVSNTPSVCKVVSNELADLTGGIKNKTILQGLSNGTCSITWSFSGTDTRAPTTKTWTGLVSGF